MILRQYIRVLLKEGIFEAPPAMIDQITSWAEQELKKYSELVRSGQPFSPLNVSKKFPIDLTGWKYGENLFNSYIENVDSQKADAIKYMKDLIAQKEKEGNLEAVKAGHNILSAYIADGSDHEKYINVELSINYGAFGASWQKSSKTLRIYYKPGMNIRNAVRHELQHFAQSFLAKAKGSKKAGFPSAKIQSQIGDGSSSDQHIHDLADEEFYTVLADEIERAKQEKAEPRQFILNSPFFKSLKKNAPDKFKKAATELIKHI